MTRSNLIGWNLKISSPVIGGLAHLRIVIFSRKYFKKLNLELGMVSFGTNVRSKITHFSSYVRFYRTCWMCGSPTFQFRIFQALWLARFNLSNLRKLWNCKKPPLKIWKNLAIFKYFKTKFSSHLKVLLCAFRMRQSVTISSMGSIKVFSIQSQSSRHVTHIIWLTCYLTPLLMY